MLARRGRLVSFTYFFFIQWMSFFFLIIFVCVCVRKRKSHPPWMFKKTVKNVTKGTFLTLFKSLSLERKGSVSPFHWLSTLVYLRVNLHCIFNNYLYLCYVMGCFSYITFDTSWWPSLWSSSRFVFSSYFVLILLDGKGAAALSSRSTCHVDWRMENTYTVYLSPQMLLRHWASINSIFVFVSFCPLLTNGMKR